MRAMLAYAVRWLLLWGSFGNLFASSRPITVWLIPSEEAEARATSNPAVIAHEIQVFNASLEGGRVHVLNARPPLAQQLIVWNAAFAVPNWAWVKNQTDTIHALRRFATLNDLDINIRFVTWDRAFADLNSPRKIDSDSPVPDVVQIGTTWAAYFASNRLIVSRPDYGTRKGSWQSVLDAPASVLPYINDIRLLFYWKRLPTEDLASRAVLLNSSSWESILDSFRTQTTPEDRIAFAGGLTLNLLMDYSMLVWAGGGEPISKSLWGLHSDFTSESATRVPRLLARAATSQNGRPLVVVPESSHQALTQAFVAGQYRATIEPANFVSRWKKDFDKTFHGKKRFWDYAAAAAPPQTFRGGSFLAVMPSSDLSPKAFELAEFLAVDDDYTKVLARNAHLPSLRSGFGMDVLVAWLGDANPQEAAQFTNLIQQANIQGKSLPDLSNWPTDIESIEIQEALQRVWRRIGEGNLVGLATESKASEDLLNIKIDRAAQLRHMLIQFWWLSIPVILGFLLFAWRSHRRVVRVLEQVKRLRGFSSMALLALDRYHSLGKYERVSASAEEARKRSIIAAGINGWRRGRNPKNWKHAAIQEVIWRGVLLAFDVARDVDLYEQWEEASTSNFQSPRDFLESRGRLRKTLEPEDDSPTYFVSVTGAVDSNVDTPFLFEQALACLLQNAIQAVDRECEKKGPRGAISIVVTHNRVTITNPGGPIPKEIRAIINDSTTPEQFENRVLAAVRSAGGPRPGIGLSEAYTIATQCYGGLQISSDAAAVSLLLQPVERS